MASKRLNIKDIAKMAGVSTTAVSFAINGINGISNATRERIMEIIERENFRPNPASRKLASKRSYNIAFVYPHTESPLVGVFCNEFALGMTDYFTDNDYNVFLAPAKLEDNKNTLYGKLLQYDADGMILFQIYDDLFFNHLYQVEMPFVIVDAPFSDAKHTHVSLNCEEAIYETVAYLIKHNHKKIGFLGSDQHPHYLNRCFSGYQRAMEDHNLPLYPHWLQTKAVTEEDIHRSVASIVSRDNPPTALCCMYDMTAIHAIRTLNKLGYLVPDDISVISIDDICINDLITPRLTTVTYEKYEMGKIAAELLLDKIEGQETESVYIDSKNIVERESVKGL